MKHLHIYTDGSCRPNPGKGGWGIVVVDINKDAVVATASGGQENTTNNRMEFTAGLEALERCVARGYHDCSIIWSDSQLFVKTYNEWMEKWERENHLTGRPNEDLIRRMLELKKKHPIEVKWVRGHNKNKWNEMADALAAKGRDL